MLPDLPIPTITPDNLAMKNPRYTGYNDDGGHYVVTAKTAARDFSRAGIVLLNGIFGELFDAKDAKTTVEAANGEFDTKNNVLQLAGGIDIRSHDGTHARLATAQVGTKSGVIETNEPVSIAMASGTTLRSNEMTLWQKERKVLFTGDVVAHLEPETKKNADGVPQPVPANAKRKGNRPAGPFSDSRAPVDITSSTLEFINAENKARFSGDVRARQEDASLHTEELILHFEPPKKPVGQGAAPKVAAAATSTPLIGGSQKIERIVANQPIIMRRGPDQQVTAKSAQFFVKKERAILEGDVDIVSTEGRRASSDRATLNQKNETILLEGNVIVAQARNRLRGQRLFVDRAKGTMRLTAPPWRGAGPGRINATVYRDEKAGAGKRTTANNNADAGAAGAIAFKTDPQAPISVEADSLDVNNAQHKAVFLGSVVARQGSFQVESATLTLRYTGDLTVADPSQSPDASQNNSQNEPVVMETITAKDKVKVTSQAGQTATGNLAVFDVKRNTVTVTGNVVLREGKTKVRGKKLSIDMTTGKTVIEASPVSARDGWSSSIDAAVSSAKNGEAPIGFQDSTNRPSAVFYPFDPKNKNRKRTPARNKEAPQNGSGSDSTGSASRNGVSSWSATTSPPN